MEETKKTDPTGEEQEETGKETEQNEREAEDEVIVEDASSEETEESSTGEETTGEEPEDPEDPEEAMDAEFSSVEDEKTGGFFRKKEKKDKKDEKIDSLTDRLKRQLAEFDNYRKRTEREKAAMYDMGARDMIEKILPVVDNFERGLAGADESDPFADGMLKIYKQMMTVLTDLGVTPIEAEGQPFDPNFHNAVMHEDNPDVGENIITQELQKGYMYKDTVLRYSMVKVAN